MLVKSIFPVLVVLSVVGVVRSGIFGCWMTEFECENENCIPMSKKCDGNDDCGDGSDEKGCDTTTASPPTRPPIPTATGSTRTTRGIPMGNLTSVKALLGSTTRMITTTPNSALVIRCRDLACGRDMLNWYKPDGELPEGSYVFDGQLVIPKVDCEETGPYICYCSGEGIRGYDVVELEVDRTLCTPSTRINFWDTVSTSPNTERQPWMTQPQNGYLSWWECKNGTGCYQFCCNKTCVNVLTVPSNTYRCKEGSYVPQSSVCNKIIDCPDGSDEIDCEVTCSQNEFQCGDGTCIPEIQKCDGEVDCLDGTDESSCMGLLRPMLTLLPGPGMEIDCADPDMQVKGGHVLQLECDFFGRPIPEVKWKKNEGHVPSKCISNSKFGHGILVCPNFQQSDQGAYSCVGENSLGTAESQPKTIVKCKEITCENGFRVRDEHNVETCLKCFCSGRSQSCHSLASKLVINSFNFPRTEVVMLASNTGEIFKPNGSNVNSNNLKPIKYCLMPEEEVQKHGFLMSYGRNLNLPAVDKKAAFLPNAPDVVMIGGGVMLTYSLNRIAHNSTRINVRFWNDNWLHADTRHASRIDIMDVLAHLQQLYIRCEYKEGVVKHDPFAKITLESAVLSDDSDAVSYVEKCSCPVGYDGLSCELCAPGYKRDADRDECIFQPIYPPKPCPIGSMGDHCDICDEANLYYKSTKTKTCVKTTCNAMGSLGLFPDDHDECLCKEKVIGKNCDMCEEGYFYLDKANSYGCKKCWCSDATLDCKSSDYRRTTISSTISAWGGFNESNGGNFWLLPSEFSGNLLTSYGGFLRYTMKYKANVEKQPKALSVEILGATGVTIRHVNANRDINLADTEKTLSVPLEEPFWKDNSNAIVTRERLLSVLSQVKAIYVESPYHLSSGKVWITAVELDSAEDASNDIFEPSEGEKALKVEICECPVGYTGTSCESCSPGYYRQRNGLSSYVCAKCECELQYCDPLKGCAVCPKGKYNNNTNPGVSPVCLDCPCHGNEESCIKDDYNLIMCFCKPGYHGARCEIGDIVQGNFIVSISPILVLNKRAGTFVSFNCSYISDEEHRIEFEKKYAGNPPAHAGLFKVENYGWYGTLETNIETNLESVDCIVRNFGGRVIAWVSARVIGTVTDVSQPNITNCYDEPKYATENEDVYLRCDATGSPEPEITWHRVDKMGNLVVVDTTDGIHTIPSVNLGFNGTKFMCLAKNSHGDAKCMTRLIVRKRCVLSIQPFNPEVMEGDPIEFTCSTASGSTIVWSRTDDPLPKEAIITGGSLYIRSVQMSDMGEYKCTANDPYGPSVKTTRLTVKTRRTPPTAEILERDMQISEGSSVAVECSVTGSPWPKITWAKLEDVFPSNVRVSGDGVTLHITNANVKNTGMYQCRAESFLNATSRILISVVEKPEIIVVPDEINAKLGETVQVECIPVKGEPFTSLEWMHHNNWMDSDISTGNKLRFESIESHDSGVYTCRARNVAGEVEERVTINVGTPPVVTLKPSHTIHAVPKDQVDVRCLVEGNPRPEIKWYVSTLPRLKINPGGNRFPKLVEMFEERGENLKVTVTEDLESVVCEATNIIGVASATVKFDVKAGKPENRGLSKQVRIGTRVELDFSMLGMPINCTRQKGPMIGDECYTPNGLEIMNAQVQHTGTYKCTSKTDEMSYTLKVDGFVHKFTKREMSYLILPMTVKSATEFQVEITFKPERQSGFLLMKKKHHAFAMYLKRGKLTVKLRRHSEEVVITTEQNLQLGVWHTAVFKLRNNAELAMYDEEGVEREIVVEGKKFEMNWLANVEDSLYVGGVKVSERHLPLSPVDAHFEGCISRVIVDGHEYKMTEEGKISQNVSLCNICSSGVNPCGGDSVCYDAPTHYGFVCVCGGDVCRKNCMGRPCQTSLNMCQLVKPCGHSDNKCFPSGNGYRCQCAEGYSGIDCSREEAYEFSLNGDGYLKLPDVYLPRNSLKEPEVISIAFTPAHDLKLRRATLFSQGNDRDYLEIYMEDDSIVYVYNNQRNKLQLTGPTDLSNEYRVVVTRRNNTAIMMINEEEYSDEVPFSTNRVYGDIYIGGSPKKINCERTYPFYRNCEESTQSAFKGCIHEITINGKRINTLAKDIVRRNIQRKCKTDKYMETADYSASVNDDSESSNDDIF